MPLHWKINSEEHLFEVVCDGRVDGPEVDKMLDVLVVSEALGYRKLFDGSRGETALGPSDILHFGVRIRALHATGAPLGPLAVVIPRDKFPLLARVLGILSVPNRPFKSFPNARKAREWLQSMPLPRRAGRLSSAARSRAAR